MKVSEFFGGALYLALYFLLATSFIVPLVNDKADKLDVVLGFIIPFYGWGHALLVGFS